MLARAVAWIRALPIIKALSVVLAGLMFGIAAGAVVRRNAKADTLEHRAENNAARGSVRAQERAVKQTEQAENHRVKAAQAASAVDVELDNIGKKADESITNLVSGWNTERVRND